METKRVTFGNHCPESNLPEEFRVFKKEFRALIDKHKVKISFVAVVKDGKFFVDTLSAKDGSVVLPELQTFALKLANNGLELYTKLQDAKSEN